MIIDPFDTERMDKHPFDGRGWVMRGRSRGPAGVRDNERVTKIVENQGREWPQGGAADQGQECAADQGQECAAGQGQEWPQGGAAGQGQEWPQGGAAEQRRLAGIARAITVMDRLRSPGGCPWDIEQTHESLVKYLLEESYELADAVDNNDRENLREELGDVLLQVLFHARIAQEHPTDPFTFDDVAGDLAAKLEFRHPHVFSDVTVSGPEEVTKNWAELKKQEKGRESVFDGIPLAQGALSRAQKVLGRAARDERIVNALEVASENVDNRTDAEKIGFELLEIVRRAARLGIDAEGALRQTLTSVEGSARRAEAELTD